MNRNLLKESKQFESIKECIPEWLASSADNLIVVLDKKGHLLYSNATFNELDLVKKGEEVTFDTLVKYPNRKVGVDLIKYCFKRNNRPTVFALGNETSQLKDSTWTKWDFHQVVVRKRDMLIGLGRMIKEFDLLKGELFNSNISNAICDSVILSVTDNEGRILLVNDNFCAFTQYNRAEIIGKRHREVIYDFQTLSFWKDMMTTVEKGKPWNNDVKIQSKDGQVYWFHTLISPVLDDQGGIVQLLHIQFDITEHKVNEEEKLELFNRYDRITANLPGFVFQYHLRKDDTDYFPFLSYGIMDILGLSPMDLKHSAEQFFNRIHHEDRIALSESILKSAKEMSHWNTSFRIFNTNHVMFWVQIIATPSSNNEGGVMWHGFCYDISERKRSEEKVMQHQKTLSEIAFIQAHEFRRPIANMLGIFDMIKMNQEINGKSVNLDEWLDLLHFSVKETDAIIAKIVTKAAEDDLESVSVLTNGHQ